MTDATAIEPPATTWWLDTIKTLMPVLILIVTFMTGVGSTMLAHHLTREDKKVEAAPSLGTTLVRLGDVDDIVKQRCEVLDNKLGQILTRLPPPPLPKAGKTQPVRPLL